MTQVKIKAKEMMPLAGSLTPTIESKGDALAQHMLLALTNKGNQYIVLGKSIQVGSTTTRFLPLVQKDVQDGAHPFELQPGEEVVMVETRRVHQALSGFGAAIVTFKQDNGNVELESEEGSKIIVKGQPCVEDGRPVTASQMVAEMEQMEQEIERSGIGVSLLGLSVGLPAAIRMAMMPGNTSDMRGVTMHIATDEHTGSQSLHIVGAHQQAMYVYEVSLPMLKGAELDVTIMPESAKRMLELLKAGLGDAMDKDGGCKKDVLLCPRLEEGVLLVKGDDFVMEMKQMDFVPRHCEELMAMPGKNVIEVDRIPLLKAVQGLQKMGETECRVSFGLESLTIEGEAKEYRGERTFRLPCQRYGADEELQQRKLPLQPLSIMLSAASAADAKKVKLLVDADEETLCLQVDEFNLWV